MLAGRLKRAWTSLAVFMNELSSDVVDRQKLFYNFFLFFSDKILHAWKPQSSFVFHDGTTVLIFFFLCIHWCKDVSGLLLCTNLCLYTASKDHWHPVTLPLFRVFKQVWKKMHLLQVLIRLRIELKMASQKHDFTFHIVCHCRLIIMPYMWLWQIYL